MNAPLAINPRRAAQALTRAERILVGGLLTGRTSLDVVAAADRAGWPLFDMARAAYGLQKRGLVTIAETHRAAARVVAPAEALAAVPVAIRARCVTEWVAAVVRNRAEASA